MEGEGGTEISFPFVFSSLANVEKDDGKSKRKKNYVDKNNAKVAEIGHAEEKVEGEDDEEEEKRRRRKKERNKRKTREEIPVMNGGCSRFNESPRWSSTGNKESVRDKRSKKL